MRLLAYPRVASGSLQRFFFSALHFHNRANVEAPSLGELRAFTEHIFQALPATIQLENGVPRRCHNFAGYRPFQHVFRPGRVAPPRRPRLDCRQPGNWRQSYGCWVQWPRGGSRPVATGTLPLDVPRGGQLDKCPGLRSLQLIGQQSFTHIASQDFSVLMHSGHKTLNEGKTRPSMRARSAASRVTRFRLRRCGKGSAEDLLSRKMMRTSW